MAITTTLQLSPSLPTIPSKTEHHYITDKESTLEIQCHDRNLNKASVIDMQGNTLFTLETKDFLTSWSLRRTLKDASSGQHILDLRHYKSKLSQWVIEDTAVATASQGGKQQQLCIVKDNGGKSGDHPFTMLDGVIAPGPGSIDVNLQSFDRAGTKTVFQNDGVAFAEMLLSENNDLAYLRMRGLKRTVWQLRVAGGVDLALVLALAFCRIEVSHAWRR